ncbi:MAG TPA: flippase activity-associated protein Agl23, partial [Ktedonobacteraceae bacterium]|nr:flippase activity-associated protein Agl23 [Ktedonobacteraceae bacterium]
MKSFDTRAREHENEGNEFSNEIEVTLPESARAQVTPDEQEGQVDQPLLPPEAEDNIGSLRVLGAPYDPARDAPPERRRLRLRPPTREQIIRWAPFWGLILLGAILRFWGLGDKPLHHDESLHAYYSLQLLGNLEHWSWCIQPPPQNPGYACYTYNPLLHGPFQFHAIALVYWISQRLGAPDNGVNTTTVRITAATLGTLMVGLPYFLRDHLGKWGAWIASFLLAVSPTLVYFSRFAREDIYFAFFTFVMIVGVARYVRDRKMRWLVVAAAGFSFAYATKESIFLMMMTFGCFLGALAVWELGLRVSLRSRLGDENAPNPFIPQTFAPVFTLIYLMIAGIAG